jgi:hypothetical protein
MSNESVDDLISQLETLRIQEASVLQRLVTARERETRARTRSSQGARTTRDAEGEAFRIGDRVQVTNRVRVPIGRTVTINDRRATVTHITQTRIYFLTNNGNSTWRARTNLGLVNDSEVWTD